jgi:fumarate reductase subunit C
MSRRPYIRPVSRAGWWLSQPRYFRYMLRELSSLFIGGYMLILTVGLLRLSQGPAAYEAFLHNWLGPAGVSYAVFTLIFALYHTYTWFQVTPKAMPIVLAGKRVPGFIIVAAHWAGFALVSTVLWLLVVTRG